MVSRVPYFSRFYLTGGTALSAVYYNHRESDDLDFFTDQDFTHINIQNLIKQTEVKLKYIEVTRNITHNINEFILSWDKEKSLKIDFNYFTFQRLETGLVVLGVQVDSLIDIAVNKLETILIRGNARDYVDFFTIFKKEKLNLPEIRKLHKKKFEINIDSLQMARSFLKVKEARDYPIMKTKFDYKEMEEFFESLAKGLESEILS